MKDLIVKQVSLLITNIFLVDLQKLINAFKALVYAHNDGQFSALENSTTGVIFFATPHIGSRSTNYGVVLQKLAKITAEHDKPLMKKLQRDSDTLARLTLESRHQLSRYKVVSFYETQKTDLGSYPFLVERSVQISINDLLT